MSQEMNKIAAAVLTGGIVAMLSGFVAGKLYHPETLEKPAFAVALPDPGAGSAPAEAPVEESILPLLASADVEAGKNATRACAACHTFDEGGANGVGPNLWNIVGSEPAHVADFNFSDAIKKLASEGKTWDYTNLDHFLADPKGYAPGTKMSYAGLRRISQRADMIAYLRTLSATPVALPTQAEIDAVTKKDESAAAPAEGATETAAASDSATDATAAAAPAEAEEAKTETAAAAPATTEDETTETAAAAPAKTDEDTAAPAQAASSETAAAAPAAAAASGGNGELGKLIAAADVDKGKRIARQCTACHSFEEGGPTKVGPNLYGVIGATAGEGRNFNFSKAMEEKGKAGYTWTYQHLYDYLENPRKTVPGTKMAYPGLRKSQDRADVIAYMRSLDANSPPLPQ
ncbi:MAG: hypothetical protein Kilf2KO_31560 [Rhodospirillales bacterium]